MNKHNNWAIIANAAQPDLVWMQPYLQQHTIIVCDGAYDAVKDWDITIDTILGDFDSTNQPIHSPRFVHTPDQNKTDLQKAIEYADQHGATSIRIFNALGNEMSHTLHNLRLLKRLYKPSRPMVMLHPFQDHNQQQPSNGIETVQYLTNQTLLLQGQPDAQLSLFGFPECTASSHGLAWDLEKTSLVFADLDSSRNRLTSSHAIITIKNDALLMMHADISIQLSY